MTERLGAKKKHLLIAYPLISYDDFADTQVD
jgi:hypothetical protein